MVWRRREPVYHEDMVSNAFRTFAREALVLWAGLFLITAASVGQPVDPPAVAIRVAALRGPVEIVRDGEAQSLTPGAVLRPGDRIQTGTGAAVAIEFPPPGGQAMTWADAIVLGPETLAALSSPIPNMVEVEQGVIRFAARNPSGRPGFTVRFGERVMTGIFSDAIVRWNATSDDMVVMVGSGETVMQSGTRRLRTGAGQQRLVEQGKIRGVKSIVEGGWIAHVRPLELDGFDPVPPAPWVDETLPLGDGDRRYVQLATSHGSILMELDLDAAPQTAASYLRYMNEGFYDGTIFHRIVTRDMVAVQAGGVLRALERRPRSGTPFPNESSNGLKNVRGAVSVGPTRLPEHATSDFYISVKDNQRLDDAAGPRGIGVVFGRVIWGMDIVEAMSKVETSAQGALFQVPVEPITIRKAREVTRQSLER